MKSHSLEKIFNPRSVAYIGVSRREGKYKNWYLKSMFGSKYKGEIFLINPNAKKLLGLSAYPNIKDVTEEIDLAVITLPAQYVLQSTKDCVKANVKAIIIITSGFAELGKEGEKLQREIVKITTANGIRIVGPNCMGIFSSSSRLNTSGFYPFPVGDIALVTQSGNIGEIMFRLALRYQTGFSKFISVGNQADIMFHEYLEYLGSDPQTKVIAMYVEGFKNGKSFLETVKKIAPKKPIVMIKVGKSEAGARSAASHTGSFAGNEEISNAILKQNGIIRIDNYHELIAVAEAFTKLPYLKRNQIATLGGGGGHGTLAADAAAKYGLKLPILSSETQEKLKAILPEFSSCRNPVDITGGGKNYPIEFHDCAKACLDDDQISGAVIYGMFADWKDQEDDAVEKHEAVADKIGRLVKDSRKPIIMQTTAAEEIDGIALRSPLQILRKGGVPVYATVEMATKAMASLYEYHQFLNKVKRRENDLNNVSKRHKVQNVFQRALNSGYPSVLAKDLEQILDAYQIPVIKSEVAKNCNEACQLAEKLGFPVAMRIYSPHIIHKSDAGGVQLNIRKSSDAARCYEKMIECALNYDKQAEIIGVMVSPMGKGDVETIVGMMMDKQYGPVIMFGLGGIFVEVLKDVSFRVPPLTQRDAMEMIKEIKGYPLLDGARGGEKKDINALADIIVNVSQLVLENPEIKELDLNPVFAQKTGALVIDSRMILG